MITVTLFNEKGGVGKTTLATYIAVWLCLQGYRVLFLDAEQQQNAARAFGFQPAPDFYDLIVRNAPWDNVLNKVTDTTIGATGTYLYTILGNAETRFVAELDDISTRILRRLVEVDTLFDFCIVDSSPTLSGLHKGILNASDHYIIPTDLETFSILDGIPQTQIHANNVATSVQDAGIDVAKLLAIIPNRANMQTNLHQSFYNLLKAKYGDLVWEPIPAYVAIPESQLKKRFLFTDAPQLKATRALTKFCEHLLSTLKSQQEVAS